MITGSEGTDWTRDMCCPSALHDEALKKILKEVVAKCVSDKQATLTISCKQIAKGLMAHDDYDTVADLTCICPLDLRFLILFFFTITMTMVQ